MKQVLKKSVYFLLVLSMVLSCIPAGAISLPARPEKTLLQTETVYIPSALDADQQIRTVKAASSSGDFAPLAEEEYLTTVEEAGAALREQMKKFASTVTICYAADPSVSFSDIVGAIQEVAMAHTGDPSEGDYLRWQYNGIAANASGYSDGSTNYYTITFTIGYYMNADQAAQVDTAVAALLAELNLDGLSDYEKLNRVYTWMCANITYDYDNLYDDAYVLKYTAYASLIDRTSVCQGYALLLYRMMLELGIDCRVITGIGNGGAHAWNIVKIDGMYYNLDATWDASWYQAGWDFNYFLRSNATFEDHYRYADYETVDFNAAYPMSGTDYVSGTGCQHDYVAVEIVEATCLNAGYTTYVCSVCGDWYQGDIVPAGAHNFDVVVKEPTCEEEGYTTYTCTVCGFWYTADYISAEQLSPWIILKAPTMEEDGLAERTCAICGETEQKWLPRQEAYEPIVDLVSAFHDALWILDAFYDLDVHYMIKTVNSVLLDDFDYFDYLRVSAADYEAMLNRYFAVDEAIIAQIRDYEWSSAISYDPIAQTYTIGMPGGLGGALPPCEMAGYVKNGDTYEVYFCQITYAYLWDALPDDVDMWDYAESLGWPETIEYDGIVYENGPDGYAAVLGLEKYGNQYTVEVNGDVVRILSVVEFEEADLPAHLHYHIPFVVEPTANSQGYTQYTCSCGDSFVGNYTDWTGEDAPNCDNGHTYEVSESTDPTCQYEGSVTYTCEVCGESYTETVPVVDHNYEAVVTPPTCTESGYTTYKCVYCGNGYTDDYVDPFYISPWEIVKAPTAEEEGLAERLCPACGELEQMILPVKTVREPIVDLVTAFQRALNNLDHLWGYNVYYVIKATNARILEEYGLDGFVRFPAEDYEALVNECFVLDDALLKELREFNTPTLEYDEATHTYLLCRFLGMGGYIPEREMAGYVQNGDTYEVYYGHVTYTYLHEVHHNLDELWTYLDEMGWPESVEYNGTVYVRRDFLEYVAVASMDTYGKKYTVEVNGGVVRVLACEDYAAEDLPDHLHMHSDAVTVDPTCTEQGYTGYICTCGDVNATAYVDAIGHSYGQWYVAIAPTEDQEGEERRECERCDHYESRPISTIEHVHSYEESVTEPTCTEDGAKVYTCRCGDTYTEIIPAIGHNYEAVVTDPTCTEQGYTTHTCTGCGASYTSDHVDALGHKHEAVVTAPTCTEAGYTTYTCHCGDSYVADQTDPVGHAWDDGVVTKEPTTEAEGEKTYTCSVCGETRVETIAKKANVIYDVPEDNSVTIPENDCFEDGTTVTVDLIVEGETHEVVVEAMKNVAEVYVAYEFTATKNDFAVQPNGDLTVTFAIPEGYSNNIAVYYMEENGKLTKLDAVVDAQERTITVVLEHFSTYIVVDQSTAPDVLLGDVNGDGKINSRDARALLRYIAGLAGKDEINVAVADYNEDGKINSRDARALLRAIAGLN